MAPKKTTTTKEPTKVVTERPKRVQLRNFCCSLNNYTEEQVNKTKEFFEKKCDYAVYGKEVGKENGTPHLQIYCELSGRMEMQAIKKWVEFNNIQPRRSELPKEAAGYCKKADGEKPEEGWIVYFDNPHKDFDGFEHGKENISSPGVRSDLVEAASLVKSGEKTVRELRDENPNLYHQFGRTLDLIESDYLGDQFRQWETIGIWLWGDAGVGKGDISFKKEHVGPKKSDYKFHWNGNVDYLWRYDGVGDQAWQDNYRGQPYVVINEFRGQLRLNDLLRLVSADILDVRRRNKGTAPFLARTVVVNSIKKPEEIFKNEVSDEPWDQFKRRFSVLRVNDRDHAKKLVLANVAGKLVEEAVPEVAPSVPELERCTNSWCNELKNKCKCKKCFEEMCSKYA